MAPHIHRHDHGDDHEGHDYAEHSHGVVDPSVATHARGLWAIKWSGIILLTVAFLEFAVVAMSRSTALLADMIHNFGDAGTVVPLWIAFALARRAPGRGFPFGYGRVEDLAGVAILGVLVSNALFAGYEAVSRIFHPELITHLGIVAAMSIVSFVGNEGIAVLRIKVGREIGSAALIADGQHARVDGWTALAVLAGAAGVKLGFPLADPIIGLLITAAILGIVWTSAKTVFTRILDGVEPTLIDTLRRSALEVSGVVDVADVRARWVGHQLYAEASVIVSPTLTVNAGHVIAAAVQHQLMRHIPHVANAVIHICPAGNAGAEHHAINTECMACEPIESVEVRDLSSFRTTVVPDRRPSMDPV